MSEPIVLRSDALAQLKQNLGAGEGSGNSSDVSDKVDSLSSGVADSKTSISSMRNDIAVLKSDVETLKLKLVELVSNNNLTLEELNAITVPEPDAPKEEDHDSDAPVYTVTNGTLNSSLFQADATSFCRHYTYDNLHMVIIYAIRKAYTFGSDWVDVATFPSLNGYTGHGYITPLARQPVHIQFIAKLEGNKIKMKAGGGQFTATTAPIYQSFFWFDRSAQSKLFEFEDGQLLSSNVSVASPSYAVHAKLGNLHLLTISTQLINELRNEASINVAQFTSNLAITTGTLMGWGYTVSSDLTTGRAVSVSAPNNNTIQIMNQPSNKTTVVTDTKNSSRAGLTYGVGSFPIPGGSFITINLMWIDARTVEGECVVKSGTTAFTSNDAFAKHFNYKHINLVQMYGSLSVNDVNGNKNPHAVGVFNDKISLPASSPRWEGNDYTTMGYEQAWRIGTKTYSSIEEAQLNGVCVCDFDNNKTFTMPGITCPTVHMVDGVYGTLSREQIMAYSCYENIQIVWFS